MKKKKVKKKTKNKTIIQIFKINFFFILFCQSLAFCISIKEEKSHFKNRHSFQITNFFLYS